MVIWLYDAICFFDILYGGILHCGRIWSYMVIMPKTDISTSMSAFGPSRAA